MNGSLLRVGWRTARQHKLHSLLLILGVALGVAVIVAMDLANGRAGRAFRLSMDSLSGRATHQIVGGPAGVPDSVYRKLRVDGGYRQLAPVASGSVAVPALHQSLRLLGVDPLAEAPFRSYLGGPEAATASQGRAAAQASSRLDSLLTTPGGLLIAEELAGPAGLRVGSQLELRRGGQRLITTIVGLLRADSELGRQALSGLLLTDIASAQELLGTAGWLSHIDLRLDGPPAAVEAALAKLRRELPAGLRIERPASRSQSLEQMSRAFTLNLTALSLLSLLVGMFLIYNTVTFSVVKRRPLLGTLRALGATRGQLFAMVLGEAALLGLIGIGLGLGLGVGLGQGAVRLVTRTLNDLYFTVSVTRFELPGASLLWGAAAGMAATLLATLLPAWEATRVAPVLALRRSELEVRAQRALPGLGAAGLLLGLGGGLLLLVPTQRLELSYGGLFAILLSAALLSPLGLLALLRLLEPLCARLLAVPGRLAVRSVRRSLSRTGVATAALMIAVAVIVGVGIMISSFRQTVADWLGSTLAADLFVSAAGDVRGSDQGLDPALTGELTAATGVQEVVSARSIPLWSERYGGFRLVAVSGDISRGQRRFLWAAGSVAEVWSAVEKGAVIVSEPFAFHHHLPHAPGSRIELPTDDGPQQFAVAGIFYDYASDRGVVLMDDGIYRQHFRDRLISTVGLFVKPGQPVEALKTALQQQLGESRGLVWQSNRSLRQAALEIFDRTFAITAALRLLAAVVAFIGVLSTLMALQLERGRELGLLRATGMTVSQLWRMGLCETGLIGLCAGLLALPLGTLLALILIYVINLRSFGWTLGFAPLPVHYLQALAVSVTAALLAGIYPAYRSGQIPPAAAMRDE